MDDLISRQAAIDASKASMSQPVREKGMEREVLDELVKRLREPCQYENCILCQQAADAIEELMRRCEQSAQPTQNNDSNALEVLDCVSRQAAIAEFSCCELTPDGGIDVNYAIDFLEQLPSAQPERCEDCENFSKTRLLIPQPERKKAKWIIVTDSRGRHAECPYCGEWKYHSNQKFCGECGAEMKGEEE